MKIRVVHDACGRESFVQQILDSGGHCPWDGKPFNAQYTAILAEALRTAEEAGSSLENALEKITGMEPDMKIEEATLIDPMREQLGRLNARPARHR